MKETMKNNLGQYQLRKWQLLRILEIMNQTEKSKNNGVVFFGDSITQMYPLQTYLPEVLNVYNCGIAGATAEELLWVVDEAVIKYQPKVVVILIGINDLGETTRTNPAEIALSVQKLINLIHVNCENTKIVLLSTLPCVEAYGTKALQNNANIQQIYKEYQKLSLPDTVTLLNCYPYFVDDTNQTIKDYYQDGLHLNSKGYQQLTKVIKDTVLSAI